MANDVLTEIQFWSQVMIDAKRTVLVNPDLESRAKGWVDARGLSGLITVKASPVVPVTWLLVLDEQALAAEAAKPMRDRDLGLVRTENRTSAYPDPLEVEFARLRELRRDPRSYITGPII